MAFNLINFKKGTLAGLNALKTANNGVGAIEEGTFYLTIDDQKETSRLYIGTASNKALPVNSNIAVVTNVSELEDTAGTTLAAKYNDGDFAYVTNGNILAVKYNNQWTQINAPDSRAIKNFTPSIATNNGVATITWTMCDQNNNVIKQNDNTTTPAITMTGANGVNVSNSGTDITITGTAYEMHSAAVAQDSNRATVKLQSKSSASGTLTDVGAITVSAGDNVTITGTADNIVIAAKDTTLTPSSVSAGNNAVSGFDITVKDSENNGNTGTINPKITLGNHTASADEIAFASGVANLPVYTKTEVDTLMSDVDAMVYKGTIVGDDLINQTNGVYVGDTFKAAEDFDLYAANSATATDPNEVIHVKTGDILIVSNANKTNGATEPFTGSAIKYDVIPAGDEVTVYYGLGANNTGNGIEIKDKTNTTLASIEIEAGNQVSVSSTHSGSTGSQAVVTVAHGTISNSTNGNANIPAASATAENTQNVHDEKTFNVVTGITTDNGHVTGTTITPIKVVDTVSKIDTTNTKTEVSASNNVATVASTIVLQDENNVEINRDTLGFSLGSDNLTVTASGTAITANFV